MAITQTYITADLSASATKMSVSLGTGFPTSGGTTPQAYLCQIDKERFLAVLQPSAGNITIAMRGYDGTAAAAHDVLAKVEVSAAPSDFADPSPGNVVARPPYEPSKHTLGESITYTSAEIAAWGVQPQEFALLKATALAVVLVAPSKAQDGLELVFTSLNAVAHIITATSLLGDAVSGSPHTTATFAAYIGATLTLKAENGIWNVVSSTGVTVS